MNIIIDGNIGSGKSTVLNNLKVRCGINVVYEDVNDWKEYINQFYKNMEKFSFSFQMKVLLHHLKTFNQVKNNKNINVLERSPLSCLYIFGKNLLNQGFISNIDYNLMIDYNEEFGYLPKNIIYIKTNPEICLKRIKERNRSGEDIPLNYLEEMDKLYNELYLNEENLQKLSKDIKVIIIDGNKNKEEVLKEVEEKIKLLI